MIAVVDDGKALHIVRWTGRIRLHAAAITYCGIETDAGNGVYQLPDQVFTQGLAFTIEPGVKRPACPRCRVAAQAAVS